MARGSRAPEHGATAQTPPADRRFAPTDAPPRRASMAITGNVIVEAADRHDAEEGYSWRWEVIYGEAHRSGACQTRAQAEREAAIVLVLLKGR
jgi:hypothetical protein